MQHRVRAAALREPRTRCSLTCFPARRLGQVCGERPARDIEKLIDDGTRAVFCETVGNPAGNICDVEAIAGVAHRHGVPLIVDNTVATPILMKPIDYGADVVVHSLTKFMGGHGTTLGGAIVDSGRFPWKQHAKRFAMFNEPDPSYHGLVYADHFGDAAYIARCRSVFSAPPERCWRAQRLSAAAGIETVALRVERHVDNARRSRNSCAATAGSIGSLCGFATAPIMRWRGNISAAGRARS